MHFMSRIRRLNGHSQPIPVAAEVLEVRSLLSAGASAVHAAMHHAAIQSPAVKQPPIFQGAAIAVIQITGGSSHNATGTALVPHFTKAVGSKVTASFTFSFSDGGNPATIKGTYSGTVRQIEQQFPLTIYGLDVTGGKLTLTEKVGGKTIKATATPAGNTTLLELNNGVFDSMGINDSVSLTAKGGFAGKAIQGSFGPSP
jgi:hypothetical protein